jgi:hypothetical protein
VGRILGERSLIARIGAVAAGVWLMFAPAVLAYGDPAAANDRIFGPLGASLAFVAIWEVTRPLRWATLPVGVWLLAAPFVLGYDHTGALISSIAAGVVMAGTAPLGGEITDQHGGGWSALIRRGNARAGG